MIHCKFEGGEIGWACGTCGGEKKVSVVLVWKHETKRSFGDTGKSIRVTLIWTQ
jgi:hypothetical protein